ncbi:hypothetical protein ANCCAN_12586 [Ancylostoma caninum]|uniref:SXP/RAL-2 family protein Ani s 5-like cation-binding domain-containing protein n=1 Tax=Ancylostoma caninum TaxID=29170 RepID=A0A368GF84_ANCCA|nr:hypothetical protein ANCCAN_12586 [Ancylostoma caninum]
MRAAILLLCFGFAAGQPNGDLATAQIQRNVMDPAQGAASNTKDIRPSVLPMFQSGNQGIMTLNEPMHPAQGPVNNGLQAPDSPSMNFQPFHGTKDIRPEKQPMVQTGNQGIMTLEGPMHPNMIMTQPGIFEPQVQHPFSGNFSKIGDLLANMTSKIGEQISNGFSLPTHAGPMGQLLGNVSKEGMEEFMNITHNAENSTIAEMKVKMSEWASKNGLKDQFATIEGKSEARRTETLANATMIVNSLPGLFQHLVSIIQNDQQSIKDLGNATDAYFRSLDPATVQIMSTITRVTGIDMLLFKLPHWNSNGFMGGFDLIKKLIGGGPRPAPGQMDSFFPQISMFGQRPMKYSEQPTDSMDIAEEHENAGEASMAHE